MSNEFLQIGFLTEWQMYAQKLEGDHWKGEKMDVGKIEKMSGTTRYSRTISSSANSGENRSAARADV